MDLDAYTSTTLNRATVGVVPATAAGVPAPWFVVDPQEKDNWCWAAVAVGVYCSLNDDHTWKQCSVATAVLGNSDCDCCDCANAGTCDQKSELAAALSQTGNLAPGDAQTTDVQQVADNVGAKIPVCLRINWHNDADQGHYVGVNGAYQDAEQQYRFSITDPVYGTSDCPATDLLSENYGKDQQGQPLFGMWVETYITQKAQ
jgi:hypothetical protein